jgi:hypothetical protein
MNGMVDCTNKIRATASRTCVITNVDDPTDVRRTGYGCTSEGDCAANKHDLNEYSEERESTESRTYRATCPASSDPEPSRSGPVDVLDGAEGAYLFCFHPERSTPEDRQEPDCGNFIVPPQSAFISGKGGLYDVIISQYKNTSGNKARGIADWLYDRNGKIIIYDRNGLYDMWEFRNIWSRLPSSAKPWPPYFPGTYNPNTAYDNLIPICPNDATDLDFFLDGDGSVGDRRGYFGGPFPSSSRYWNHDHPAYKSLVMTFQQGMNTNWVPVSIDTTNRSVRAWDQTGNGGSGSAVPGAKLVAYEYFADLFTKASFSHSTDDRNKYCLAFSCDRINYRTGYCSEDTDIVCSTYPGRAPCPAGAGDCIAPGESPPSDLEVDGVDYSHMCTGSWYTDAMADQPACDEISRRACEILEEEKGFELACADTVRAEASGRRCVKFCTTNRSADRCIGPANEHAEGASGSAPAFCGGAFSCSSDATRAYGSTPHGR